MCVCVCVLACQMDVCVGGCVHACVLLDGYVYLTTDIALPVLT